MPKCCVMVAALLIASACSNEPATAPPLLSRLELRHPSRVVVVREQTSLSIAAFDAGNRFLIAPLHLTWSSSDTSIATVDRYGLITGLRIGQVVITASSGDVESSTGLNVRAAHLRITLQTGPRDLLVGDTAVLRGEFLDLYGNPIATDMPIRWTAGEHVLSLEHPPVLSGQQVKIAAQATGLARVLGSADGVEGVYIAPVVTAPASTPPVEVTDFDLMQLPILDDFAAYVPSIRLRIIPGHEVNLLRVEVAVERVQPVFPALCGTFSLPAGEHDVLGFGSYPRDLLLVGSWWPPSNQGGVVLLTYRDGTGALTSVARRGGTRAPWDGDFDSLGVPWHVCP